ncbi:hypothetical protein F5Y05DRAFT_65499 [Hypoxylon sp. FL0543]|nr:hypothetical protein F5Y05DRAFT_65499 [Hypoxylon sp. FL0543]
MIFARVLQLLSFVALATFVAADGATCQTSEGSPWAADCQNALIDLKKSIPARLTMNDCVVPNENHSKCYTVKKHGTCKVDLCFNGKTASGIITDTHIVDAGAALLHAKCGRYSVEKGSKGLKVGGFWTWDNPHQNFLGDVWCRAPNVPMRVQFSKA